MVESEQEPVAAALGDVERRDDAARLEGEHRDGEQPAEDPRQRGPLVPAGEDVLHRRTLAGELLEPLGAAEHAELDAGRVATGMCSGGAEKDEDRGEERATQHRRAGRRGSP
jgi:hypothetical protein